MSKLINFHPKQKLFDEYQKKATTLMKLEFSQVEDVTILNLKNHLSCGENNFFFENGTIEFVVTGDDCQVKVKLTSYVQITTRIETTINDFYEQDFIDNIVAFLGIDPGRLKIVSVSEGSVIVKFVIQ